MAAEYSDESERGKGNAPALQPADETDMMFFVQQEEAPFDETYAPTTDKAR